MNRPKDLREIKWLVDYVALRCTEREGVTGFRVEVFEDIGMRIGVDMGDAHMNEIISFCELATSNVNVVGVTLDHIFADLANYRKSREASVAQS